MAHIREVPGTDDMDWAAYYSAGIPKGLSDAAWRVEIGHRGWKIIHGAIENYPCDACRRGGTVVFRGVHDLVNIHLGKPVRYPEAFQTLFSEMHRAKEKLSRLNFEPRDLDAEMSGHTPGHAHKVEVRSA
jgi:hypothetical protein